jgi:UDP-N-acetyl-D-mannosaminuronic acid dehydrogenase
VPEEARLIRTAREVNDHKPEVVLARVKERADRFKAPVIAALGLAFKPDIDDLRESPALEITKQLALRHPEATVLAVEPNVDALPTTLASLENVRLAETVEGVAAADIVVLLVDHKEFRHLDRSLLAEKALVDTRGVWR